MTTQISVETISPFPHNQIPVITTELLAQLYGTEILNIQVNFTRNKERFVEGKHFFKASGEELKNLRLTLSKSQNPISPKARPHPMDRTRSSTPRKNAGNRSGVGSVRKTRRLLFQPKTATSSTKPPNPK